MVVLIIDQFQKNKTSKIFKGEINNIVISVGDDLPLIKKINGKINLTQKKISSLQNYQVILENLIYFRGN